MFGWQKRQKDSGGTQSWGPTQLTVSPRSEREENFVDDWDNKHGFRQKALIEMEDILGRKKYRYYFEDLSWNQIGLGDKRMLLSAFRQLDNEKKKREQRTPARIPKISRDPSPIEKTMMTSPVKSSKPLDAQGVNESTILVLEDGTRGVFKGVHGEASYMRDSMEAGTYYLREAAAYEVCKFLGWDYCPETVIREHDGEVGSFMRFAEGAECGSNYSMLDFEDVQDVYNMAFYNIVIGNTDRHGRNWMYRDGKPVAIDHGLAFHDVRNYGPSLRSGFVKHLDGKRIPDRLIEKGEKLLQRKDELASILSEYISPDEVESVFDRVQLMLDKEEFDYWDDWGGWG